MDNISLDRRDVFRGAAATAVAGGLLVTAGEDAHAARPDMLRQGDTGWWVQNLQRRLLDAHFWLRTADGRYDDTTQQAVMALQKVHGLSRDGVVGPKTWTAVYNPTTPRPRSSSDWEIDKSRQLQIVARWGWAQWVFNTSTGNGERYWSSQSGRYLNATTPSGRFRFYRSINGMRIAPLGELWRPIYFNGGIAIHGSPSIPGYAASHGCARLSNRAINYIWWKKMAPIGRKVYVY